jgi:ribosomal protein S14
VRRYISVLCVVSYERASVSQTQEDLASRIYIKTRERERERERDRETYQADGLVRQFRACKLART